MTWDELCSRRSSDRSPTSRSTRSFALATDSTKTIESTTSFSPLGMNVSFLPRFVHRNRSVLARLLDYKPDSSRVFCRLGNTNNDRAECDGASRASRSVPLFSSTGFDALHSRGEPRSPFNRLSKINPRVEFKATRRRKLPSAKD